MTRYLCVARLFLLLVSLNSASGAQLAPAASSPGATHVPATARSISEYSLSPEVLKKANTLGSIRFAFRIVNFSYLLFVLWFLLKSKLSARFRDWAESVSRFRFLQALIYTPLLVLAAAVMLLPFDFLSESLLKYYGISVQSWTSWTKDRLISRLLIVLIASIFTWILFNVIRRSSHRWWLYFGAVSMPILLFIFFMEPLAIDPLFNRFEPLSTKAPQLIPEIERLTVRAGMPIPPERMFWMLASDKTIFTNAYVTGIGATKRVVIWDTTLAKETLGGTLVMFGHEMGHYLLHHIWKFIAFLSVVIFVLLYLTYRTIGLLLTRQGAHWGIRGLDDWASLPALLLMLAVFGFVANTGVNAFSRYQENQADIYSLEVTHGIVPDNVGACLASYQMYGEQVLAQPHPNPINVFMFYDHPPVADRMHLCATYDPWSENRSPQFVK
jgi:STE24 endopeptidase